jgi:hypothetical protein
MNRAGDAFARTAPLRDGAATTESFVALARALCDAAGVDAALPDAAALAQPTVLTCDAGAGVALTVSRRRPRPDPYGGGPVDERTLSVQWTDGRRLRLWITELAWVGDELRADIDGPAPWRAAVVAALQTFLDGAEKPAG